MKNFNVILDEFCRNKYVDTDTLKTQKPLFSNKCYCKKCENERKFNNLIHELYDIMFFCDDNRYDCDEFMHKTIGILNKIKECDETSATKCFNTVNDIKNMIRNSDL